MSAVALASSCVASWAPALRVGSVAPSHLELSAHESDHVLNQYLRIYHKASEGGLVKGTFANSPPATRRFSSDVSHIGSASPLY